VDAGHHRLGVAQLGHGLGVDERGHLDAGYAGLGQPVDHLDLVLGRDEVGLDLTVPGATSQIVTRSGSRMLASRVGSG
jgi:hypothetical protein